MRRKNIFQLVEESYSIIDEAKKINSLYHNRKYFCREPIDEYSLDYIISRYLFDDWRYRGSCVSTNEYLKRVNAIIDKDPSHDSIVNFIEVMDNFVELFWKNQSELYSRHNIGYYTDFSSVFCPLIYELEQRMGLARRKYKDRIVLYPKNAPLEKALYVISDEDIQWDLIRYSREELTLNEKKKLLANFATKLEIEKDNSKDKDVIKILIGECTNILNNLSIRHSNSDEKAQYILKQLSSKEQHELCDFVFSNIIAIINLRDRKKYFAAHEKFKTLQKEEK